jgi:uncharacterized membrane protein YuzA (DUF378 family)
MNHPNAAAAGGTTGAGVLAVWLLGSVFHVDLSAELGAVIAGATTTVFLFVGRRGLAGVWHLVIHGDRA